MMAATNRQRRRASLAKCVDHRSCRLIAARAADEEASRLERRALFEELQAAPAIRWAAMDVVAPREVVEVTVGACDDESRRHGFGRAFLRLRARLVDVAVAVGSKLILLEGEHAGPDLTEGLTDRTAQPARERRNRHADTRALAERVVAMGRLGRHWGRTEMSDLRAKPCSDSGEEALLSDRRALQLVPVIEPSDDDGVVRQVDDCADAVGPKQLARPKVTDANEGCAHSVSAGVGGAAQDGSAGEDRSKWRSATFGSTSRSEFSRVNGVQSSTLGDCRSGTVVLSLR